MKDALSKVPMLRLLMPFVLGILMANSFVISNWLAIIIALCCAMVYIILETRKSVKLKLFHGYILSLPLFISVLCIGVLCTNYNRPKELPQHVHGNIATGIVKSLTDKDFSTSLMLHITQVTDTCGNSYPINHLVSAWVEGNNYFLQEGDVIVFKFEPRQIKNNGNPDEFDYAGYMYNKGCLYHTFIQREEYNIIGHKTDMMSMAKASKQKLVNLLLSSSLDNDTKTFFITILLGDSTFLEQDVRDMFAHAGISHILALSGLHIGIITLLFAIVLLPLDLFGLKKLRFLITLIAVIVFAFLVGMPVSVARATQMIGFVLVSRMIYRENASMNALFAAAILILCINPYSLYDIGFQFSFVSVLLILLLAKPLSVVSPKKELLYYFVSLFTVSVVSAIGTTCLTAYYFNIISLFAVITNIIVVPVLPIIVGFGLIYVILLSFGVEWSVFTNILNAFYHFIVTLSEGISNTQFSYIDNTYVSSSVLCLCFAVVALIVLFVYKRKIIYVYGIVLCLTGIFVLRYVENRKLPNSGYVIFNDTKCTPILTFKNDSASIWIASGDFDITAFKRYNKQFLAKYHITDVTVNANTDKDYIILGDKTVFVVNDNSRRYLKTTPRLKVDILLVTRGYYGSIKELLNSFNPKQIVLSGDIYHQRIDILANECISLHQTCHVMRDKGALFDYFN